MAHAAGDRMAHVQDPFGNSWYIATRKQDVSSQEMGKRFAALMKAHG